MPKVSRKDNNDPLQEVLAVPMEADNTLLDPVAPSKPQFAPLSAYEQNGKKLEFRRVCSSTLLLLRHSNNGLSSNTTLQPYLAEWSTQVNVPQHRMTPLKNSWMSLYTPVTENMKLDMRMNLKAKKVTQCLQSCSQQQQSESMLTISCVKVELKTNADTPETSSLQKAADFVQAFILGMCPEQPLPLYGPDGLQAKTSSHTL